MKIQVKDLINQIKEFLILKCQPVEDIIFVYTTRQLRHETTKSNAMFAKLGWHEHLTELAWTPLF